MELYLPLIFFLIALLYSIAGFGGGSSYLAVLALCGLPFLEMKFIALLCNIVVVLNSTFLFQKHKLFNFRKTLPIVLCSIPLAYLGGRISLNEQIFKIVLTIVLIVAGWLMLFKPTFQFIKENQKIPFFEGIIGSVIGFISGLVGIGGGIFLSPILNFSAWDTAKAVAATSSFFILVNSLAGLTGLLSNNSIEVPFTLLYSLLFAVFLGGQVGVRLGIQWLTKNRIKQVTGVLILMVSLRLIVKMI